MDEIITLFEVSRRDGDAGVAALSAVATLSLGIEAVEGWVQDGMVHQAQAAHAHLSRYLVRRGRPVERLLEWLYEERQQRLDIDTSKC